MRTGAHLNQVAARTDWGTPWPLFKKYDAIYGFTLDVCAIAENTKCFLFFSPDDNGLAKDWSRDVCWMNPPYGPALKLWMKKAYESSLEGATVVCLVPARTDTRWWHDYAEKGEYEFIRGRVIFQGAKWNAPFPCAIVLFTQIPGESKKTGSSSSTPSIGLQLKGQRQVHDQGPTA